jgi:hypothetical protein
VEWPQYLGAVGGIGRREEGGGGRPYENRGVLSTLRFTEGPALSARLIRVTWGNKYESTLYLRKRARCFTAYVAVLRCGVPATRIERGLRPAYRVS